MFKWDDKIEVAGGDYLEYGAIHLLSCKTVTKLMRF